MKILKFVREDPIVLLILVLPMAFLADKAGWGELWVFGLSALGVIPMAHFIGEATEVLAHYTGPRIGGLLNATLGNAAELIITILAIREGLLDLVKASITGSIIGNLLLVLGMSMVVGGIRHGVQSFNRERAGNNAIMLALVIVTLVVPSLFSHFIGPEDSIGVEVLSLGVAGIMIVLYALGLLYSFKTSKSPVTHSPAKIDTLVVHPSWSIRTALIVLALSTAGVVYLSELLVSSVEPVVVTLGISEFFLGIILIPLIGNVAEHLVAVKVAAQNQMDLSVEISVASSLQIALFVTPVLVFISLLFGNYLTLVFNQLEIIALVAGVWIAALVSEDGKSNWLEGVGLLAIYAILALAFFLLPV